MSSNCMGPWGASTAIPLQMGHSHGALAISSGVWIVGISADGHAPMAKRSIFVLGARIDKVRDVGVVPQLGKVEA